MELGRISWCQSPLEGAAELVSGFTLVHSEQEVCEGCRIVRFYSQIVRGF